MSGEEVPTGKANIIGERAFSELWFKREAVVQIIELSGSVVEMPALLGIGKLSIVESKKPHAKPKTL